jgi:hypothetical protein
MIEESIDKVKPGLIIIDSIQTMYSEELTAAPGSVSQVREVTAKIMMMCKKQNITTIIIGHVTKDGAIAGLRNAIESRCVGLKDNFMLHFNDEDYADDFDGYDTFDEFWEDFIKDNMYTSDYWTFSNDDDLTINIYIKEMELSN